MATATGGERELVRCIRRARAGTVGAGWGSLAAASTSPAACPHVDRSALARFRFPPEAIAVRAVLALRTVVSDVEGLLAERGIAVDHVTMHRWVQRFARLFADAARPLLHASGDRWFVHETYDKVADQWRYMYRAVDQYGQVIDVLLCPARHRGRRPVRHPRVDARAGASRGHHRQGRLLPGARNLVATSPCRTCSAAPIALGDHGRRGCPAASSRLQILSSRSPLPIPRPDRLESRMSQVLVERFMGRTRVGRDSLSNRSPARDRPSTPETAELEGLDRSFKAVARVRIPLGAPI